MLTEKQNLLRSIRSPCMSRLKQLAGNTVRKVEWHTRQKPIVFNKRLVFEVSLNSTIRLVQSQLPIEFILLAIHEPSFTENHNESTDETETPRDSSAMLLKGVASGKEVFHLHITCKKEKITGLIPSCRVSDKPVFIYDCYTDPNYRGRGIYPAALTWVLQRLQRMGFDRAFLRTHPQNASSIKGAVKGGFDLCGSMYHFSLFGFCPR